jgi:glycerol-3-phosphate dehydrogenase (NAD(P)+)
MTNLAIIGGGSWGTALACVLASRFERVSLWVYEPDLAARIESTRVNDVFLPDIQIPANVHASHSLGAVISGANVVITATPSHALRATCAQLHPHIPPTTPLVTATKGLESGTLLRMSEVLEATLGSSHPVAVLSGPTFAREVATGNPTAVVLASDDRSLVTTLQTAFAGPTFRIYGSHDPIGVEMGGALKNVIAIGAGISDGLGLGHNAVAALITRGLAELTRVAVALGARPETLSGLAGLGDLVLTCTGDLSRNRQVGLKLAAGFSLDRILESTPMVAEGVKTTSVALQLAARCGVDLPIAAEMNAVLEGNRSPGEAIKRLMGRALRNETPLL